MVVRLENVAPWGRSLDEYRCMFDLDESLLAGRILGCADVQPVSEQGYGVAITAVPYEFQRGGG